MIGLLRVPAASPGHLASRRQLRGGDLSASASHFRARRVGAPNSIIRRGGVVAASRGRLDAETVVESDFLVLGSGIAGLTYALDVAEHGSVVILTKDRLAESNTRYAQGGICGVFDSTDSVASHISDTVVAGAYLCNLPAVEVVCGEGAAAVNYLARLGAKFSADHSTGALHLAREGGHSHARVVHAADATGAEIERALVAAVRSHPNIRVSEFHLATELVTAHGPSGAPWCLGVDALLLLAPAPGVRHAARRRFVAKTTMLATGGAGHVFPSTTNPSVATGDGIAMAFRAGATVANLEFVQFHPTALYQPPESRGGSGTAFLISEAVRGAGGRLFNGKGERFMSRYDQREELAPRDVVARAIDAECRAQGEPCVWLDISHRPAAEVVEHFPNIAAHCATLGIDMTRHRVPVVPAAHYFCGGVVTGLDGQTSMQGLFAAGEAACTGLHGANRLASNSLLEGVVFARRAAPAAVAHADLASGSPLLSAAARDASAAATLSLGGPPPPPLAQAASKALRREMQQVMWASAGIVRSSAGLLSGRAQLRPLAIAAEALASAPGATAAEIELRNLTEVSDLVLRCAVQRRESRGLHYNVDFPEPVEAERRHSVICGEEREARVGSGGAARLRLAGSPRRGRLGDAAQQAQRRTPSPQIARRRVTMPSELNQWSSVPGGPSKRELVARAEPE